MTLNQLRYFRVLAKTEHYSKAADALGISQPSLSRAISLLEEELNVLLFTRRGATWCSPMQAVPCCAMWRPGWTRWMPGLPPCGITAPARAG